MIYVTLLSLLIALIVFLFYIRWYWLLCGAKADILRLLFLILSTIIELRSATISWRLSALRPWKSGNKIKANVDSIYKQYYDQIKFHYTQAVCTTIYYANKHNKLDTMVHIYIMKLVNVRMVEIVPTTVVDNSTFDLLAYPS